MAKQPLDLRQLFAYIKNRLGYGAKPNTSLYELVCLALEKDGKPRPFGTTHQFWADINSGYLYMEVSKFRTEKSPKQINVLAKENLGINQSSKKRSKKARSKLKNIILNDPIAKQIINTQAQHIAQKIAKAPKPTFQPYPTYQPGLGKEFYITREWRQLRYKVLTQYGTKCQCCGETKGYIHVDHIKPRSLFPELELDQNNLQVLCEACNIGKSNQDTTDWRQK